jgi:cytochrome P450
MPTQPHSIDASVALTDLAFTIPPVPTGGPRTGIRWLRRNVARFADGTDHVRRRGQATSMLAGVEVAELRRAAADRTRAVLDRAGGGPVDLMADIARVVPVDVLGAALGIPALPAGLVAVIAKAYQPGSGAEGPADEAVAHLVELLGGVPDESTAARIALLVQALDATAGLIGRAAQAMLRSDADRSVETIIEETLRQAPPVRATRRVAPGTATVVLIDLAAGGLPFGAGPHQCPGRDHATAIAAGILESVRGCRLVGGTAEHEPPAVPRVPAELMVTR